VHLAGPTAAGKTGTAEAGAGRADHAWFAGYFPAENPKYVVVVALEHGGSGARAAGPVARELFKLLQARLKTEQLQTN
jgi:penicillin-binding protein 2